MMKMTNVAHPYVNAIFDIAKANNSLDQWQENLRELSIVASNDEFSRLVANPQAKEADVMEVLLKFVSHQSPEFKSFLQLLFKENRMEALPAIYEIFRDKIDKMKSLAHAVIQSAYPLSDSDKKDIVQRLSKKLGKTVEAEVEIVKDLIGGIKILIDDLVIDASVKESLNTMATKII